MTTVEEKISAEDYYSWQREYWSQVVESNGFDIDYVPPRPPKDAMLPIGCQDNPMMSFDCQQGGFNPYRILVKLYAKLGLHRYNILKGSSFELSSLMKFNMLSNCVSSFYITLLAHNSDPAASTLQKTFQVRVDEEKFGSLDLTCSIARPKDESAATIKEPFIPHFHGGAVAEGIFRGELPDWLSDDALNDGKRFYVVKDSEWQANDWISMYLELVVFLNDRSIIERRSKDVPLLEILKVAIETAIEDVEPPNGRLKAKSANVYIMFKGWAEARAHRRAFEIGEHVERKAIVRRVIDEHTGYLTLMGKLFGGQYIKKKKPAWTFWTDEKVQSLTKRARLG